MFWFSDNGFKKKGKVGRVFIFCFYFQSNMGRVFIFCFYFQRDKNIMQTSSILLFWQTNNTIVFTRRDLDFPTDTFKALYFSLYKWETLITFFLHELKTMQKKEHHLIFNSPCQRQLELLPSSVIVHL
jgi:hypothetical protein